MTKVNNGAVPLTGIKFYYLWIIASVLTVNVFSLSAKDYPAALFGISADGTTLNTRSIQFGIDYISNSGGGRLLFKKGIYLTGTIHLKSDVVIQIDEGAVLLGSVNIFDYDRQNTPFDNGKTTSTALILGNNQHNVGIIGKGTIDGQGKELAANIGELVKKGFVKDNSPSRPEEDKRPMVINLFGCDKVTITGINLKNSACWVECYNQCKNVNVDSIHVNSQAFWNNDGIDIVDCNNFKVSNSYFDCNDDGICLKSLNENVHNQHIRILNNDITSGASGIKFGTASHGGFSDIQIRNNKVHDTYRSVLALEAVDGAVIENIVVDSLQGINVGNGIFLRIGARMGDRNGRLENVSIQNVSVQIREEKKPRIVAPAIIIAGLPGQVVTNVTLKNITVKFPGGADLSTKVNLKNINTIPEKANSYPEFSMFGDLPSWGVYIRHAKGIQFNNLSLQAINSDARTAIVLDDAHQVGFKKLNINKHRRKKKLYSYNSIDITVR